MPDGLAAACASCAGGRCRFPGPLLAELVAAPHRRTQQGVAAPHGTTKLRRRPERRGWNE